MRLSFNRNDNGWRKTKTTDSNKNALASYSFRIFNCNWWWSSIASFPILFIHCNRLLRFIVPEWEQNIRIEYNTIPTLGISSLNYSSNWSELCVSLDSNHLALYLFFSRFLFLYFSLSSSISLFIVHCSSVLWKQLPSK